MAFKNTLDLSKSIDKCYVSQSRTCFSIVITVYQAHIMFYR